MVETDDARWFTIYVNARSVPCEELLLAHDTTWMVAFGATAIAVTRTVAAAGGREEQGAH